MNYFIGGSSRCGKSTLAHTVRRTIDVQALSGDAFRDALRKTSMPGTMAELHQPRAEKIAAEQEFIDYHTLRASDEIVKKRAQASLVWSFLSNYLVTVNRESEDSVLVESIDVWPDLIATSGLRHRAVFMVDTSLRQWERIAATRGKDHGDWMHANGYSDARIQAWSTFNVERSGVIKGLCYEYGYPCIDIAETGFDEGQRLALEGLMAQSERNGRLQEA